MKFSMVLLISFLGASISLAKEFNFGALDVQNDCVTVRSLLGERIEAFAQKEKISRDVFIYSVSKTMKRNVSGKGGHLSCVGEVKSLVSKFDFFVRAEAEHYGENRNSECATDNNIALNDVSVVGVRMNLNQGWQIYPFCQSFELFIGRNQ